MKRYHLVLLIFVCQICTINVKAQIRDKGSNYLELLTGVPILSGESFSNWKNGEHYFGASYAIGTTRGNYHRITLSFKREYLLDYAIKSSSPNYENITFKYGYEKTLAKGKNHLSYFGLLYGLGVGMEKLNNSYNTNIGNENIYPLLTVGLNFEKFLTRNFALFSRIEADATIINISQKTKGTLAFGIKVGL